MKKIDIQNAVNVLGPLDVNQIKDVSVRDTLVYDYSLLRKLSRAIEQERADLVEKFQSDFAVEAEEARALRQQGKAVTGPVLAPFLKAEAELNRSVRAMFREEVSLELLTMPVDEFVSAMKEFDYTLEDLSKLDGIVFE